MSVDEDVIGEYIIAIGERMDGLAEEDGDGDRLVDPFLFGGSAFGGEASCEAEVKEVDLFSFSVRSARTDLPLSPSTYSPLSSLSLNINIVFVGPQYRGERHRHARRRVALLLRRVSLWYSISTTRTFFPELATVPSHLPARTQPSADKRARRVSRGKGEKEASGGEAVSVLPDADVAELDEEDEPWPGEERPQAGVDAVCTAAEGEQSCGTDVDLGVSCSSPWSSFGGKHLALAEG